MMLAAPACLPPLHLLPPCSACPPEQACWRPGTRPTRCRCWRPARCSSRMGSSTRAAPCRWGQGCSVATPLPVVRTWLSPDPRPPCWVAGRFAGAGSFGRLPAPRRALRPPQQGVELALEAARAAYSRLGAPDSLQLYVEPGCGHECTEGMWRQVGVGTGCTAREGC